jgi:cytochrome c oxidase cbb3-type subunit 3
MTKQKKDEPRGHVFDGIYEYDNDMPQWWLALFWITIVFSLGYMIFYHANSPKGMSLVASYEADLAADAERRKAQVPQSGESFDWSAAAGDEALLARAKETWMSTCTACHLENGAGSVGPNLTDKYWIHGFTPEAIEKVIRDGVPANGMPAWGPVLGDAKVRELTVFVRSIRNSNVAGGKAPQGEIVDEP